MRIAAVIWLAALVAALVAVGVGPSDASGERSGPVAAQGYTFDTGPVKLLYGANASYWVVARAQGTYCGGQPLGGPWRVWGSYVQYIEGEGTLNPIPADGTATFDRQGKQLSRSLRFPWFVQEVSLRLEENPPKADVWFWNGQLVSRQRATVELKPNPSCTLKVAIRSLDCTPEPASSGKRMTGRALATVTRAGVAEALPPTATVAWRATLGSVRLKLLSTTRAGSILRATWKLPQTVRAKAVRVTLTVTNEGATATRTHLHRVR